MGKVEKAVETAKRFGKAMTDSVAEAGRTLADGLVAAAASEQPHSEAVSTASDAAGGASDEKRVAAEGFAERANEQRDRASAADNKADYARAVDGQVPRFTHLPEDALLELRFGDGETFFDGARAVTRDRFRQDGFGVAYLDPVTFEADGPLGRLREAWLVALGGGAVRCEIASGPYVGGGHEVHLPGGHLIF